MKNIEQDIYISDVNLRTYLTENKLMLTFCILQYGIKLMMARWEILEKKIDEFRNYSLTGFNPTESLTAQISRRQVVHLDLLSTIFMFMEDFLGYSHNLREPLHKFPKLIASKNYGTVEREISRLKKCKKKRY